jgi:hypothetical protein
VWIGDLTTGQEVAVYRLPPYIHAMAFSPDGAMLAISHANTDDTLRNLVERVTRNDHPWLEIERGETLLLDAKTGHRLACLPFSRWLAFRPDGKTLVTYSKDDAILLWDIPPRTRFQAMHGLPPVGFAVILTAAWWRVRRRKAGKPSPGELPEPAGQRAS